MGIFPMIDILKEYPTAMWGDNRGLRLVRFLWR